MKQQHETSDFISGASQKLNFGIKEMANAVPVMVEVTKAFTFRASGDCLLGGFGLS